MIYLIINAFIYMMLACYWAQVFPGMNGKPQKPYFFLLPSYWLGNKAEVEPIESDDGEAQTNSQVGRNTIVVNDVRKTYGAFEALKGISMTMKRGEVTAFLGHNGAGKTTLSHIISCDTAATQGDVNVFGVSVNNDPYSIRCMVGLCKQDDYLWANLTAREHLELFAGLRGVSDDDMGATVQKWLESVDLADVQLQYSSSFSGGMKRRLSVALATIGERPLIILDEPTTGMDPVSRRFVWRHIDEIKENRVVILTTHAMEEADLLAEEVAIMRRGDLAAFGSPLELKTQYGSALQFTLLVEREDVPSTQRFLNDFFAGTREHVKIDAPSTGNIIVNIQKVKVDRSDNAHEDIDQGIEVSDTGVTVEQLSTFMEWLSADSSKVQEYGFSNSSLEEVFLKVTGEAALSNDVSVDANGGGGGTTTNNTADPAVDRLEAAAAGQSNPERLNEIARFKPSLTVFNQVRALIGFYIHRNWVGRSSMSNYIIYSIMFGISVLVGLGTNFGDGRGYLVLPILFVSLMLVGIIGTIYSDRAENLFYLMRTQGLLPKSFLLGTTSYAFLVQFLFTFLTLTVLYFTPMFAKQQVCTETSTDYCDADFAQKPQISWSSMTFVDYQDTVGNEQVEIRAYRERGGYGLVFLLILCFTLSIPGSVLSSSFLPGYKIPLVAISFICVMASLVPLILFALAWVNSLRQEVSCTNDFQEYSDKPKITIEDSSGFCNDSYNQDNLDEYFVNCVGLDINSIYQFCIEPSASLLPQVGLFQGLSMVYSNKITFVSDPPEYARDVLIPNISGVSCSGTTCNFPYASRLYWQSVWIMCLGSLCLTVIGVFATMTLGFPNTAVLRVRMYIVHFFEKLRCKSSGSSAGSSSAAEEGANKVFPEVREESRIVHEAIKSFTTVVGVAGEVEEGTVAETLQLDHNSIPRDAVDPVITHKLSKTYPALGGRPPKRALEDLDLHVPKGQCLGFLGKNVSVCCCWRCCWCGSGACPYVCSD
uniref:ABC transporter domain-containing protein n=1 Tax=Craspedostauros australis TaxID=1486917 RepID=A0A6T6FY55_9STRA